MPAYLTDDPAVTISISLDRDLLERLNDVVRLSPEAASRSKVIRDLLNLSLDILLEPVETLPSVIASLREHYAADAEDTA